MPINVAHEISPFMMGQASYQAGLAQYQQEEQARQDQLALQQQAFEESQRRTNLTSDLQRGQQAQDAYEFQQRLADSQKARQAQLMAGAAQNDLRAWQTQYAGDLQRSMLGDRLSAGLYSDTMQQQNMRSVYADRALASLEANRQTNVARQLMGNYEAIQRAKAQGRLDDSMYEEAMDKLAEQYNVIGMPAPFAPDLDSEDPDLEAMQAKMPPGMHLSRDPNGKIYSIIPPQYTPEFQEREHNYKMEQEAQKQKDNEAKLVFDQQRFTFDQEEFKWRQQELADKQKFAQQQAKTDLRRNVLNGKVRILNSAAPKPSQFTKDGIPNDAAYSAALEAHQQKLDAVLQELDSLDDVDTEPAGMEGGEQAPQWVLDLPPGTPFTAPDGSVRIKQ